MVDKANAQIHHLPHSMRKSMDLPPLQCITLLSLLALFCVSSSNGDDMSALLAFKAGITSDPFRITSSWNRSLNVCNWTGISCNEDQPGRVTVVDLTSQSLSGTISASISNLTFLHTLLLINNSFTGEIPPSIGELPMLQHLNLSSNSLGGAIPVNLVNCSELITLGLLNNKLVGSIPPRIGSLTKLQELVLSKNGLTGSIPNSLANISSLYKLSLLSNFLEGRIPEDLGRYSTNLSFLQLSVNNLSGTIPPSLFNLSSLYQLAVTNNELEGSLPPDIGNTLPSLRNLLLSLNQFQGPLPASLANASSIRILDMSTNSLSGVVPPELGKLPNLIHFNVGANRFQINDTNSWRFMDSLTNCSRLMFLDLNMNNVGGALPESVGNLSTTLQKLRLYTNRISGSIPPSIENLSNLEELLLLRNSFTGTIPDGIGKLAKLKKLGLSSNRFTGSIPRSFGNLTELIFLYVNNNRLTGPIPSSFGKLRQLTGLDLSSNGLNGSIPKEVLSLPSLSLYMDLSNNSLEGPLLPDVGSLKQLTALSLSNNKLSGEIPSALGNCESLQELYMSNNLFEGTIPESLGDLKGLQTLNLSHNGLSGLLPKSLYDLNFSSIDLSYNHLEGEVLKRGAFMNATAVSLLGNDGLCGGIRQLNLTTCIEMSSKKGWSTSLKIAVIVACVALVSLIAFSAFAFFYLRRKSKKKKAPSVPSFADKYLKVSYNELFKATNGFSSSNLIGAGGFGSVYRGILDPDGGTVAVKVFDLQRRGASKSFMAECEALRGVRHRNLIKILTACSSIDNNGRDFKALVYEFMPNGSLEAWLHPRDGGARLNLSQRLNVAVQVADALDYLHGSCDPPVIHCDMKPSNVLLDLDLSARVGDFGLARFVPMSVSIQDSNTTIGIKGSIGYIPPEYGAGVPASTSGDVYSYGILLLEMFTGASPVNDMFKDGLDLRQFVQTAFPHRLMDIVDASFPLEDDEEEEREGGRSQRRIHECLVSVIRVGLSCSKEMARERMSIRDAAGELRTIRNVYLKVHGDRRDADAVEDP